MFARYLGVLATAAGRRSAAGLIACGAALQDALSSALTRPGSTLWAACETVTQALSEHGEDDITLVLARIRQ